MTPELLEQIIAQAVEFGEIQEAHARLCDDLQHAARQLQALRAVAYEAIEPSAPTLVH